MASSDDITRILGDARNGQREALDEVFRRVYDEIRAVASRQIARAGRGETLSTTAVVHEAYLKLVRSPAIAWEDRGHFFAVAATAMRQILLNHARARAAKKRGGGVRPIELDTAALAVDDHAEELIELDAALDRLERVDERLAKVVNLRFFAGLTAGETAEVLGVNERTVKRDWRAARAFLHGQMGSGA